jgi:hypothetical protein
MTQRETAAQLGQLVPRQRCSCLQAHTKMVSAAPVSNGAFSDQVLRPQVPTHIQF